MRMQQNAALCNTRKRCLPLGSPGCVPARLAGGPRTVPGTGLGTVKSRSNSLFALYSSVQRQESLPKPLAKNNLRPKNRLCPELKCPKMSGFVMLGKRCFGTRNESFLDRVLWQSIASACLFERRRRASPGFRRGKRHHLPLSRTDGRRRTQISQLHRHPNGDQNETATSQAHANRGRIASLRIRGRDIPQVLGSIRDRQRPHNPLGQTRHRRPIQNQTLRNPRESPSRDGQADRRKNGEGVCGEVREKQRDAVRPGCRN